MGVFPARSSLNPVSGAAPHVNRATAAFTPFPLRLPASHRAVPSSSIEFGHDLASLTRVSRRSAVKHPHYQKICAAIQRGAFSPHWRRADNEVQLQRDPHLSLLKKIQFLPLTPEPPPLSLSLHRILPLSRLPTSVCRALLFCSVFTSTSTRRQFWRVSLMMPSHGEMRTISDETKRKPRFISYFGAGSMRRSHQESD